MADADTVTPLCSPTSFSEGAFADLVSGYSQTALSDLLVEATRKCEGLTDRRLAPFTGLVETHRASAVDPDEYVGSTMLPMDIRSVMGYSYAQALGAGSLVRHTWLDESPPRYQDLWAYSGVTVTIIRSYGGSQQLISSQILDGPDDTGHVWFMLGMFIPQGSRIRVTYSGGYQTTPGDLLRACKYIAAGIAVTELDPVMASAAGHDPDRLFALGEKWLAGYARDGSPLAAKAAGR